MAKSSKLTAGRKSYEPLSVESSAACCCWAKLKRGSGGFAVGSALVGGRCGRFSREALATLCTVSTFLGSQQARLPVLVEVLRRASRALGHFRRPPLRAQRVGAGQSRARRCGDGIGGARLAQAAAVIARLLELAHAVVCWRQYGRRPPARARSYLSSRSSPRTRSSLGGGRPWRSHLFAQAA